MRRTHVELCSSIAGFLTVDLVRRQEQWKTTLKDIRSRLEAYDKVRTVAAWKSHMDHQLYKVLECQYRRGLETLNESVSRIALSATHNSAAMGS